MLNVFHQRDNIEYKPVFIVEISFVKLPQKILELTFYLSQIYLQKSCIVGTSEIIRKEDTGIVETSHIS
jgi:hypothetical protein